jgi:hypothetical protein
LKYFASMGRPSATVFARWSTKSLPLTLAGGAPAAAPEGGALANPSASPHLPVVGARNPVAVPGLVRTWKHTRLTHLHIVQWAPCLQLRKTICTTPSGPAALVAVYTGLIRALAPLLLQVGPTPWPSPPVRTYHNTINQDIDMSLTTGDFFVNIHSRIHDTHSRPLQTQWACGQHPIRPTQSTPKPFFFSARSSLAARSRRKFTA